MSKISNAYDAILARLAAVLDASYTQLPNAYAPERCPDVYLNQGYGVALGAGVNTKRFVSGQISIERNFTVVLSQKYYTLESDTSGRPLTEKALYEDQLLILSDFNGEQTLNGNVYKTEFLGDGGIEFISNGSEEFLLLRTTFAIEYQEN